MRRGDAVARALFRRRLVPMTRIVRNNGGWESLSRAGTHPANNVHDVLRQPFADRICVGASVQSTKRLRPGFSGAERRILRFGHSCFYHGCMSTDRYHPSPDIGGLACSGSLSFGVEMRLVFIHWKPLLSHPLVRQDFGLAQLQLFGKVV